MIRALFALSLLGASPAPAATCAPHDPDAVAATMRAMFVALEHEDPAIERDFFDPGFYAFDNGKRFDGMALPDLIKSAHAAGKIYHWNVTKPDVRIACDTAWIAYVNDGEVGDAAGMKPMQWLESAELAWKNGKWRILFMNSQRTVPAH